MDFYAILDQVITLLRQRQRVTYRALKVQFQLEDDALEALKEELIEAQHLAADEAGRILVWTGGADVPPLTPLSAPSDVQPTQSLSPPAAPQSVDAERRQLTVMFCDLVDSTKLSSQLDPEEYRDVVRAYQRGCTDVIQRYDGHIAQLLGDGLLIYFGYPQAHEDDAQRAVRTGLGILDAMGDLHKRLEQEKGIQLALRLGVHTGLVVVGEMGSQGKQEHLALGQVPNIAARLQGLASSDTLVISDATLRLVQGYFECQDLGAQTLRGIAEPITVYQVLRESGATSRLDVAQPRGLTPLVGRDSEVTLLQERWQQAKSGQGQVVLLTGDAGIGKSRLVQMLKEHIASQPHTCWECRSLSYFENTALFPLTDLFQRLLRFQAEESPDEKLGKLEQMLSQYRLPLEETVPLFAPLLSVPVPEQAYPLLNLSPQRQRQKTLETIVAILLELAELQPVLFIVEDLHWTDPSTLELLNLLIEQTPTASLLTVGTSRPTFQPSWSHRSYLSEITVNRLSHAQVAQIVTGVTDGKTLPQEIIQQIVEKTDGVPLFVEEITKSLVESGQLKAVNGYYELTGALSTLAIPATLQDSLMARLDRLVTAKGVAQIGATIGRQFAYDLLQAVSQVDASTLQRELGRLVEAEIVYQRGLPPQATYVFKHALIQDAAYQSLLRSTRQQYHQRIAQMLVERFPETAETQPELLAQHYTEAALWGQALPYWQRAGERAIQRSANLEAISHLTKGLEVLKILSDSPERTQQELTLQVSLGVVLAATKGWAAPEVERAYARARELCQQVGETPQLFTVLWGLSQVHIVRADLTKHREVGAQFLSLAEQRSDAILLAVAHWLTGVNLFHVGEFATGLAHLEQAYARYDPQHHHTYVTQFGVDVGVFALSYISHALWGLGYPDQAVQRSREALALAQEVHHPFSVALAQDYAAMLQQFRREQHTANTHAEIALTVCTEQGFAYYLAWATIIQGWVVAETGQREEGIPQMHQGLTTLQATGGGLRIPYYLALLAEAYGNHGEPGEGLHVLAGAFDHVQHTGECWWEAELHRRKGELLLQGAGRRRQAAETPEACFHRALEVARHQEAKSLELRAAMSLARLWQQQGKRDAARDLLAPIYGWFTEGFDTADLQEAKALLEALV